MLYAHCKNSDKCIVFTLVVCFTRQRRALPGSYTRYLEVLIVADTTVVNFVGKDKVKSYILGLMNIVSKSTFTFGSSFVEIFVNAIKHSYFHTFSQFLQLDVNSTKTSNSKVLYL